MRVFRIAAVFVVLTGPAYAQVPSLNLIPELVSKTPEEKEQLDAWYAERSDTQKPI